MKKLHFLTRREWVAKHKPDKIDAKFLGGVYMHPRDYGLDKNKAFICEPDGKRCDRCWDMIATRNGRYIAEIL